MKNLDKRLSFSISLTKMDKEKPQSSYNKFGFYFFALTVVFSSFWASYFLFFKNKIDLGEYADQTMAEQTTEALSPEEEARPWVLTEGLVAYGSKVYQAQCALCHGAKGLGDGTPGLIPPPRNLVEGEWKQGGSSKALFITLQKGIEGSSMVSFKHLSKLDRWALVHYVRSITKNKVVDNEEELEKFAEQAL
ncbi:MAG: cytochrome c [Oligoflexia bacterium]|nr:cytochrome c [Oligoflexia bacterium]